MHSKNTRRLRERTNCRIATTLRYVIKTDDPCGEGAPHGKPLGYQSAVLRRPVRREAVPFRRSSFLAWLTGSPTAPSQIALTAFERVRRQYHSNGATRDGRFQSCEAKYITGRIPVRSFIRRKRKRKFEEHENVDAPERMHI